MTTRSTPVAEPVLHVFTRPCEPATRYNAGAPIGHDIWITNHPRRQLWCGRCGRKRWASRLVVQVYYDGVYTWCADKDHCYRTRKRRR